MNATVPHIKTRFALFLDPDFFIVPPLAMVLDHMKTAWLVVLRRPYAIDPLKSRRQDFPCAFCMFVDTEKVDISAFDFMPDVSRLDIMADTGIQIYTRYADAPLEVVLPSYPSGSTDFRHTRRQLKEICPHQFTKATTDAYFWDDKLFGIHLHMKLHIYLQTIGQVCHQARRQSRPRNCHPDYYRRTKPMGDQQRRAALRVRRCVKRQVRAC